MPKARSSYKTRDDFDSKEEFEEYLDSRRQLARQAASHPAPTGGDGKGLPEPIIYTTAIESFIQTHEPASWPAHDMDVEFLSLGDIRMMLAAVVPFSTPDAMPQIVQMLEGQGFRLQVVPGFPEPVIPVKLKYFQDVNAE